MNEIVNVSIKPQYWTVLDKGSFFTYENALQFCIDNNLPECLILNSSPESFRCVTNSRLDISRNSRKLNSS